MRHRVTTDQFTLQNENIRGVKFRANCLFHAHSQTKLFAGEHNHSILKVNSIAASNRVKPSHAHTTHLDFYLASNYESIIPRYKFLAAARFSQIFIDLEALDEPTTGGYEFFQNHLLN